MLHNSVHSLHCSHPSHFSLSSFPDPPTGASQSPPGLPFYLLTLVLFGFFIIGVSAFCLVTTIAKKRRLREQERTDTETGNSETAQEMVTESERDGEVEVTLTARDVPTTFGGDMELADQVKLSKKVYFFEKLCRL